MNIHPIFVHFPIALLTVYALLELVRFKKIKDQPYWFYLKAILVILGTLGSYVAFTTGNLARHAVAPERSNPLIPLIRAHENFAQITVMIFSVLAAGYLIAWLKRCNLDFIEKFQPLKMLWKLMIWLQVLITETPLTILLAIAGFVALTITGVLGGSIVYGHQQDPFTNWVYNLMVSLKILQS